MNRLKHFLSGGLIVIVLLSLSLTGCDRERSGMKASKKIAVLQFGTHPVIDSVVSGFETRIKQVHGDKVSVVKYNGNFDLNTVSVLSKQMVASDADILIGVTTPASGQLIGANRGMRPLVFTFVSEPKAIGYTGPKSLKNTTGLSDQVDYEKTLQLIKIVKPQAKTIGYLLTRSESNALAIYEGFKTAAPGAGLKIITATIGQASDIRTAAEMLAPKVDTFLFGGDNTVASAIDVLISTARGRNIPIFACDEQSVERGAVAAYSVDYRKMGEKTADISSQILSGGNPEEIPVEIFTGSRLVINENAAKAFRITIPVTLSSKADRIIK